MDPDKATRAEVADALDVCAGCSVLAQCQAAADSMADPYGVWAGVWRGEDPLWMVERVCAHCGGTFRTPEVGQKSAVYCSTRCRVAEHRAVRAAALAAGGNLSA